MQMPIEWLPAQGRAEQLILLLHGWGAQASDMAPLAQALRAQFPQAAMLAPEGTEPYERDPAGLPTGRRQWYAIKDITPTQLPQLWPQRVAGCLPSLQAWVLAQQQRLGVGPAATCLAGFSQGAVLSLALAVQHDGIAGRVLAFNGALTARPAAAPRQTTLHLLHGQDDSIFPAAMARQTLEWLDQTGGDATLDMASGVGHELHPALIACALQRLQSHIPARTWRAAMGAVPGTQTTGA